MDPDRALLLWMYEHLLLSRKFEEGLIRASTTDGQVRVGHPYIGQEAVAVGACAALQVEDYVVSNHRSHGHAIAKGVEPRRLMAELLRRTDGPSKGKGGEMGMADYAVGFMSSTEIVGGNIPMAIGIALASQYKHDGRVTVSFFGDGASNQGTFHEGLNLASIWRLPVVFICENNGYAEATPVEYAIAVDDIAARAAGYAMPGTVVDGHDTLSVYAAVSEAVDRCRKGDGPTLIEAKTYRYFGHYYGDAHHRYRTEKEVEEHKARDCIDKFRQLLLGKKVVDKDQLEAIDEKVSEVIHSALDFARQSPPLSDSERLAGVYV
jgi:TPP-dependent pyruvate/acetoin dehydrogenase alpha subunit